MIHEKLLTQISNISTLPLSLERKKVLQPLIDYIQKKHRDNININLNFICTHNSRRSHLCQIWAQTMAHFFSIKNIFCYSGGTETTAIFYKIIETLHRQGFENHILSESNNPIIALKYDTDEAPIICFSKEYHHPFNPAKNYAAILTCDSANEACPIVLGADCRIAITYSDPKKYDNTNEMDAQYEAKSIAIAKEMYYIFSMIK